MAQFAVPVGPHPRVRVAWFWTGFIYGLFGFVTLGPLILVIAGIVQLSKGGEEVLSGVIMLSIAAAVCLAFLGWLGWYVGALHRSYRYKLDHDQLLIQRGVVFRRTSRIPWHRVQDVVVRDGPFLRAVGLGTVHVQTAGMGTAASEGLMPGLEDPQAVAVGLMAFVKRTRSS